MTPDLERQSQELCGNAARGRSASGKGALLGNARLGFAGELQTRGGTMTAASACDNLREDHRETEAHLDRLLAALQQPGPALIAEDTG